MRRRDGCGGGSCPSVLLTVCLIAVLMAYDAVAIEQEDSSAQNVATVSSLYEAFASGLIEDVVALLHDDVEWRVAGPDIIPFSGRHCGKEAVQEFFSIAIERLEVIEQNVSAYIGDGSAVAVVIYEHMRVKATGKEYRTNAIHLYRVEEGKIVWFEEFVDTFAQAAAFAASADQMEGTSLPLEGCP